MPKNALLLIDAQIDFCDPKGALFVPGAEEDMQRLARWINTNANTLDYICYTLDSHVVNAIFHPNWFRDTEGALPGPFTQIRLSDLDSGKWIAHFYPKATRAYIEAIENQGDIVHTIWPEHCILGSEGHALVPEVLKEITDWARKTGKPYQPVIKGMHPQTEHYGIFVAQAPLQNQPSTELNQSLINTLLAFDRVFLAGEAQSHCVATSLKQAITFAPELARKMVVLTDCMSPVPGFEKLGANIYDQAKALGVVFQTSEVSI